jgi:hypothetical protein
MKNLMKEHASEYSRQARFSSSEGYFVCLKLPVLA